MKVRFLYIYLLFPLLTVWLLPVYGQTTINTDIAVNTTWNASGSPYIVTADIVVLPAATLLIRQGTVIQFDDNTGMEVLGKLHIEGGDSSWVTLTSSSLTPVPGSWKGIRISGNLRAAHVQGKYANILFDFVGTSGLNSIAGSSFAQNDTAIRFDGGPDSLRVSRTQFQQNRVGLISSGNTRISVGMFEGNDWGVQGTGISIQGGHFIENRHGALVANSLVISAEFLRNTLVALSEENSWIVANQFYDNDVGIQSRMAPFSHLTRNVLRNNRLGIRLGPNVWGSPFATFEENVICDSWYQNAQNTSSLTIDLSNNCWCLPDSASIEQTVWDLADSMDLGELIIAPFDTNCLPDLVFPGDANHNQVANVWDIFPIGVAYGEVGPPRIGASNNWVGQGAQDWGDTLRNGIDIKHVDCNGDGIIDGQDILPIFMNYGRRHNSLRTQASGGYELYFDLPSTPVNPGDTLVMGVYLGTVDTPAVEVYGAAFSVVYDTSFVKPGSVLVEEDSSWLGQKDVDMITAWYDSFPDGTVDMAFVRIDQMDRTGFGKLADISVVIDDDIAKMAYPISFSFGLIEGVGKFMQSIPIRGISGEVIIEINTSIEPELANTIEVYPNPTAGTLVLTSEAVLIESVSLLTISGQEVYSREFLPGASAKLDLAAVSPGMYILRIHTNKGILNRKIALIE